MQRLMMRRTWAVFGALVGLVVAGCVTTQEMNRPGALPRSRPGVKPRLNASTFMAHGHLLERQGSYARAAEQYRKALEITPDYLDARIRLGITLNKLGEHASATAEFRRALLQAPRRASLHNNLGFSLYLQEHYAEAEQALARALEIQPDFRRARMNHGLVLARLDRYEEALDDFRLAGSELDAYYNLAVLQVDAGEYAAAVRALEQALAIDPEFDAARQQLKQISRLAAAQEMERDRTAARPDVQPADALAEAFPAPDATTGTNDSDYETAADVVKMPLPTPMPLLVAMPTSELMVGPPAPPHALTFAERDWLWQQIHLLLAQAEQEYMTLRRDQELVGTLDEWVEAWILDAPWLDSARCRLERIVGPLGYWP